MRKVAEKMGRPVPVMDREAMMSLERFHWPGNVRELENVVERTLAFEPADRIPADSLPEYIRLSKSAEVMASLREEGVDLELELRRIRYQYMCQALKKCDGVMQDAARLLGISFRSFRYYYHKHADEFGSEN